MLMRTDPFRDLDRITERMLGTLARPVAMPMDAYQVGNDYFIHLDLPGVERDKIDLSVERNVLTVTAERRTPVADDVPMQVSERPTGRFSRQLFLGDTLDLDRIDARYESGVLTLRIPLAEQAKPRKIEIAGQDSRQAINV